MLYPKYFKRGQKLLLRSLAPSPGRIEALTGYFQGSGPDYFDVSLPYRAREGENFPFTPDMPFEVLSDALGMGIRLTGTYQKELNRETIRLQIQDDLQLYKRRINLRLDTQAGLRYTKGSGTIRSFRNQWEKNVEILEKKKQDPNQIPEFPQCPVNISAGGIRFNIKPPVEIADICLLLLDIGDGQPPICVMSEVVWISDKEINGRRTVGMQFLNILESDQKRIQKHVQEQERLAAKDKEKEAG